MSATQRPFKARLRDALELARWSLGVRGGPPPHRVKQRVLLEHARRFGLDTLVETGTYQGDMVEAMRRHFRRVISIELSEPLARAATERFAHADNVRIEPGDSGTVLPRVLATLEGPALFWLDGHWSGGFTARGALDTPVVQELEAVLGHAVRGHVVLVDDARLFDGRDGYPTLAGLRDLVERLRPGSEVSVEGDSIRILPPA